MVIHRCRQPFNADVPPAIDRVDAGNLRSRYLSGSANSSRVPDGVAWGGLVGGAVHLPLTGSRPGACPWKEGVQALPSVRGGAIPRGPYRAAPNRHADLCGHAEEGEKKRCLTGYVM